MSGFYLLGGNFDHQFSKDFVDKTLRIQEFGEGEDKRLLLQRPRWE